MLIEHDPALTALARTLRKQKTPAEKHLWNVLRRKQFHGYKFYRQHPIASYIADFYCPKLRLVVEIDGKIHRVRKGYDDARTDVLNGMNLTVIRYSNENILTELSRVLIHLKKITDLLASSLPRLLRGIR
jgi:very-short-patch-repair endonuclease